MDAYSDEEWKDSDDENEESKQHFILQPSYVLIAIDIDNTMFTSNNNSPSAFLDCLEACFDFYNSLVLGDRGSMKGPVCIILANNDAGKATFIDFDQPIPDSIKLLKDLTCLSNNQLKDKYLRKDDFDLGDFFLFCKNKLSGITSDTYKKSVYYITNNDNPIQSDAKKRFKVINESQKFAALEINLYVVTFNKNFDKETLYSEVLSASNSPPVEIIKGVDGLTYGISNLVKRRFSKLRMKFYPFPGDTESYLDLIVNKFMSSGNIAKNMYVTRDTQKEVKKLAKQQFTPNYSCTYNPKVDFLKINEAERACLKETNIPIGITLLYVAPPSVRKGWILESPFLVEKDFKETKIVFDAFWQYCKENSKCLVCLRKYRKGSEVRIIELVPKFVNNKRMFLGMSQPFTNDIHYTPRIQEQNKEFDRHASNLMRILVETLTFDFDPMNFSDPVISKKRAYIKSQLLNEPLEEVTDAVFVDERMNAKIYRFFNEFQNLGLMDEQTAGKRSTATYSRASKKAKGK